jgi:hypothetical protein
MPTVQLMAKQLTSAGLLFASMAVPKDLSGQVQIEIPLSDADKLNPNTEFKVDLYTYIGGAWKFKYGFGCKGGGWSVKPGDTNPNPKIGFDLSKISGKNFKIEVTSTNALEYSARMSY